MPVISAEPQWLRAAFTAPFLGVDREKNIIKGMVLAEEGPFKSEGRGEFDKLAIKQIEAMANARPKGLKSRLSHPGLSDDGIGTFLGRARDARVETGARETSDGTRRKVDFVRADLHLDPTSFDTPKGNLGKYVMDLADSDPDAFGSSLVLQADEKFRKDEKGRVLQDQAGNDLPPLWYPTRLHATDVVDTGDAVHGGFLSTVSVDLDALPDAVVRQAWQLLDRQFGGQSKEVIENRCRLFLAKFLAYKFPEQVQEPTPVLDAVRGRLDDMEYFLKKLNRK